MWQLLIDERSVAANEARHMHEFVEDSQLYPLAAQKFSQGHQRTFTQVVSPWLERQTTHPDSTGVRSKNLLHGSLD
jgi:hypothetical protein